MSAALLVALLGLSWMTRRMLWSFGALARVLRLPGNLVHELAHAIVTLACGFTVVGFSVSATDPEGRGGVQPGRAWAPWARSWTANLLSPVAPVAAGWAGLAALRGWGELPGLPQTLAALVPVLSSAPVSRWQAWVSVVLAMSVIAELSPSDIDLRIWRWPALALVTLVAAAWFLGEKASPGAVTTVIHRVDAVLAPSLASALAMGAWAAAVMLPLAVIARWSR